MAAPNDILTFVSGCWAPVASGVFNVRAYGAKGDGVTNDTGAFLGALADAAVNGGAIFAPRGTYVIDQFSLAPNNGVQLRGEGFGATTLLSTVDTGAPAIILATGVNSGKRNALEGFFLQRKNYVGPGPSPAVSGNYGIAVLGGCGQQTVVRAVEVRGFGDNGIHIDGPTGPVLIESCNVQDCAGYGLNLGTATSTATSNILVVGGAFQDNLGGIQYDGTNGQALVLLGPDIEVGAAATLPALRLFAVQNGAVVIGGSYSLGNSGGPLFSIPGFNAVMSLESCRGVLVCGAQVLAFNGSHCLAIDDGSDHVILGGSPFSVPTGTGKFAVHSTAPKRITYLSPQALAVTFPAGNNIVFDTSWATSDSLAVGVAVSVGAGAAPITVGNANIGTAKPSVTGSRGGNAALASALTGLATLGLVVDRTTA